MDNYDASSIKILTDLESNRFIFVLAPKLAEEYHNSVEFITRGLTACMLANTPFEYFIDRYLKKLPIEEIKDITEISKALQKQAYNP